MRIHHLLMGLTVLSVTWTTPTASGQTATSVWRRSFAEAWDEARQTRKIILIHFYADWCGPCRQMERTVLNAPEILTQLEANFIAVKVNSDEHPELVKNFNVRVLPCDIFVDVDADGQVVSQTEGFQSRSRYHSKVAQMTSQIEQSAKMHIAAKKNQGGQVSSKAGGSEPIKSGQQAAAPETPAPAAPIQAARVVGLDGYSPVALGKRRAWVKGKKEFTGVYQEVVFYFGSADELRTFQSDPRRFAPQLLGCDPVILWNTDRAVLGDTQYGAFFDQELYLFASAESRQQFKENPLRYTRTQHVLQLELIDGIRQR